MPRTLAPNVRSLAAADSPILDFLAPRVLGETQSRRSVARRHAPSSIRARDGGQEKNEDGLAVDGIKRIGESRRIQTCQDTRACAFVRPPRSHHAAPLLQTPSLSSRHHLTHSASNSMAQRYADIYSFTQRRLVHHDASVPSLAPTFHIRYQSTRNRRLAPRNRLNRQRRPARLALKELDVDRELLAPRERALVSKTARQHEIYMLYQKPTNRFLIQGRYRWLKRRLYAFTRTGYTFVDLTDPIFWRTGLGMSETVLIKAFAALDRSPQAGKNRVTHRIKLIHAPQVEQLALRLCAGDEGFDTEMMMNNWAEILPYPRKTFWHLILLYLLEVKPGHALQFLSVLSQAAHSQWERGGPTTESESATRPEILADAFEHLARIYAHALNRKREPFPGASELIPTFISVYRLHLARYPAICTQDLLLKLALVASLDELRRLFDLFIKTNARFEYDTILHYANRFSALGDPAYALRCLQPDVIAKKTNFAHTLMNRNRMKKTCALILRNSMKQGQNYQLSTQIISDFVNLGINFDITIYNVIMHNAMEAKDYDTAFRVYNLLDDNGIQPDKYTYGVLLHGCAQAHEPAMFSDFAEFCKEKAKEMRDPWIATDYLYWLYVQHRNDPDKEKLSGILHDAYVDFFTLEPLRPFLSKDPRTMESLSGAQSESVKMEPSTVAIYIMLQTIIRRTLAGPRGNEQVWNLYTHFEKLIRERTCHPLLSKLAQEPYIWNAFLLAFCRGQQFANASHLIKTMSDGFPSIPEFPPSAGELSKAEDASADLSAVSAEDPSSDPSSEPSSEPSSSSAPTPPIPQPNVDSWNIFMQSFFKTAQSRAAERIYEIMRSRGIEPDQFTFEVLLVGYARSQQVDKIGEVMGFVDEERQLDSRVLTALARVHDQRRLGVELEVGRREREGREKEKAKAKGGEKKGGEMRIGSLLGRRGKLKL